MSTFPSYAPGLPFPPYAFGGPPLGEINSVIENTAFPHIIDAIVAFADRRSLLALRATSKEFRDRCDRRLFSTALIRQTTCRHQQPKYQVYSGDGWKLPCIATLYCPYYPWQQGSDLVKYSAQTRLFRNLASTRVLEFDTAATPASAMAKFFPNLKIVRIQCYSSPNMGTWRTQPAVPPIYEFSAPTVVVMGNICPPVLRDPSNPELFEPSHIVPPHVTTVVFHPTVDTYWALPARPFVWSNVNKVVIVFTSLATLTLPWQSMLDGVARNIANALSILESSRRGARNVDITVVDLEQAVRRLLAIGYSVGSKRELDFGLALTDHLTMAQIIDPANWGATAAYLLSALYHIHALIREREVTFMTSDEYAASLSPREAEQHLQWTWAPSRNCQCEQMQS